MPDQTFTSGLFSTNGNGADHNHDTNYAAEEWLRSEEVTEILSVKPPFLVTWGITIFFIVLVGIVAACWFIRYPDVVPAKAKLTSINAPKEIKTKTDGKLEALLVAEDQVVKKGAVLGYLESRANAEEIISLSKLVDSIQKMLSDNQVLAAAGLFQKPLLHLGEVQHDYQVFLSALYVFRQYLAAGFYPQKRRMIQKDFNYLQKLNDNLQQQLVKQRESLALQQEDFAASEYLKKEKVISATEYRTEKSKLISKELGIPQIESSLLSNENSRNEKQKELMELENQIAQQKNIFIQSLNTFKVEIDDWKAKFLLIAPIEGRIAFATFIQQNQQLQASQLVCFINPGNSQYYAELYMPQSNFGKIRLQQKVLLKLPAYPYQEYGKLEGRLQFISNIPTDSGYLAKVSLRQNLQTNYQKQVQFRNGLTAEAEIVTRDLRLLERFYFSLKSAVTN